MKQIMTPCKICIRTLREMITGSMMLPVIEFVNIYESCRILLYILPVSVSRFSEDLIDQPHVKGPVQVKYLSQAGKGPHEQIVYEFLYFRNRWTVWQSRIKRKYQQPAVNRSGMAVLLSSVVRQILQIVIIVPNCLLPDSFCFFSVSAA